MTAHAQIQTLTTGSSFTCEPSTILMAQLGDATAWDTLVRCNVGWVFQTCLRWAGSRTRAEELAQEVFIRVFLTLHSYRGELGGFRTWLSRLTRNLLVDDYRKNRQERCTVSYDSADEQAHHAVRSVPSSEFSPEANIEWQERRVALRRALRKLDPELRRAVILRDMQDLTYQQISRSLKAPVGTVKSRVNRGRIELVRLMRQGAGSLRDSDSTGSSIS
jgi:RNA polymerase sigma-70 factor (ECF subfamily)